MTDETIILKKKLSFRAWHRGTREADLLMGRFSDYFLPGAEMEDLQLFSALLAEQDLDLYDWLTGQKTLPDSEIRPVIEKMIAFYSGTQ